jgi:Flp pilus assembly protein TadG
MPDRESGIAGGKQRGQAFVELALGMPLMLLIMLGTLDVGQVFVDYVQLRNGCREAASYGARHPADTPGIETRVTAEDPLMSYSHTTVTVQIRGDLNVESNTNSQVVVTCSRTFTPITLGFLQTFWGIGQFSLQAISTAQVQK